MWLEIIGLMAVIVLLIAYIFVIKPYRTIHRIKREFQAKGFKVLVQKLDFNDDTITSSLNYDTDVHKDALHRYKTIWQQYDVTIKNSYFMIIVFLNSIDLVKQAYKKIQVLEKPLMLRKNYGRFYGGGLLMKQGEEWRATRKLYSEIFNFKLLEELHPLIEKTIDKQMKSWKVGEQINLLRQLRTMFFNSFVTCYFGRQFNEFSYKGETYSESIALSLNQLLVQAFALRHILFGTTFLQKGYLKEDKQIEQRVKSIKFQTKQFVLKRLQEMTKSKTRSQNSILSKLIFNEQFESLKGQQRQKSLQSITGDVLMFFFAATDTTSGTFAATIHLLGQHPEVVSKILEQIGENDSVYSHSVIKNWKYTDAVMNQVLRLYGPFNWIFVREILNNDTTIAGITLPKDSILGIQTQTIHCSDKYYKNPKQFRPERFLQSKNQDPYSFVSFGAGQRNCIGQYLAKIQYKIALAKFLRKFTFKTNQQFVMQQLPFYQSKNNQFILENKQK